MKRRSRKLAMWNALFPYLGGKRRLAPLIFREIDQLVPRERWPELTFFDGFLGGGSISLYAKALGLNVIATDIAARSIAVGDGLIANNRTLLTREDILRLIAPSDASPGPVARERVPDVFSASVARFIDRSLAEAASTSDRARAGLLRVLAIRVALLAHPMSQVRSGTAHRAATGEFEAITQSCVRHYVDAMRLTRFDRLWGLAQQINGGVFQGSAAVHKASVLDILPDLTAHVAYFDPPYPGVMSYEREYQVIDEILEGEARPTSPFTAKDGASLLDNLFDRATHIPVWLLSLGNAVVGIDELEAKVATHGRTTKSIALRYQHLPAVATEAKKEANREFLVIGWDARQLKRWLASHQS